MTKLPPCYKVVVPGEPTLYTFNATAAMMRASRHCVIMDIATPEETRAKIDDLLKDYDPTVPVVLTQIPGRFCPSI